MTIKFTLMYQKSILVSEEVEFGPDACGCEPDVPVFIKAVLDYEQGMIDRYISVKIEELSKTE